ncbi:MAG: HEAT repeat domain-containing protein [Promethearchaeota archaeon]
MVKKKDTAKIISELIEKLHSKDPVELQLAAKALGEIKAPQAVDPLLKLLENENKWVRTAAIEALGEIKAPQAVDPLLKLLEDEYEDEGVRGNAARALGQIGAPRALDLLLSLLENEHKWVRGNAARALGQIGDPHAVDALLRLLENEHRWVRWNVARALGQIGALTAVDPLLKLLENEFEDELVLRGAIYALGQIETPHAVDPVLKLLNKDKNIHTEAITTLAKIENGVPAVNSLGKLLEDEYEHEWVRWNAVLTLGQIGTIKAVETLLKRLTDKERDDWASSAIGKEAIKSLLKILETEDKDERVREAAAKALGMIRTQHVMKSLITLKVKYRSFDNPELTLTSGLPRVESLIKILENKDEPERVRTAVATLIGGTWAQHVLIILFHHSISNLFWPEPLTKILKDENKKIKICAFEKALEVLNYVVNIGGYVKNKERITEYEKDLQNALRELKDRVIR